MKAAGYDVRASDPFEDFPPLTRPPREPYPYVDRLRLMWQAMRGPAAGAFPAPPGRPAAITAYLKQVEEVYVSDAYHSLSIEGYRVSPALIERVRSGAWNPEGEEDDRERHNALAARGYYEAFQAVKNSLARVLRDENPGSVADDDHGAWYRALWAPGVTAGLVRPADLAGYRTGPVYIRRSRHVPSPHEAVRDLMPALIALLREEEDPAARIVLGHFLFVYIHPYMDGNGRVGRFLMNLMLGAGGYPWTVIPVERRVEYMSALEAASTRQDIAPFATFLAGLVQRSLQGRPAGEIPV